MRIGIAIYAAIRAGIIRTNANAFITAAVLPLAIIMGQFQRCADKIAQPLFVNTGSRQNTVARIIPLFAAGTDRKPGQRGCLSCKGCKTFHLLV